jgi:hypothetical protein
MEILSLLIGNREPNDPQFIKLIDNDSYFNTSITFDKFLNDFEKVDKNLPLRIELKTCGSKVNTFLSIANILSKYPSKLTIKVHRYAYSGGTLLCLIADEIEITENTQFSGINPYIVLPVNSKQIKDMESSFIDQLKIFLNIKKYTPNQIDDIINFFFYKYDHNIPFSHESLPQIIKNKIVLKEK